METVTNTLIENIPGVLVSPQIAITTTFDQVQYLWNTFGIWIVTATALCSGLSAIWKQKEEGWAARIQALVNLIALNVGYAKNK